MEVINPRLDAFRDRLLRLRKHAADAAQAEETMAKIIAAVDQGSLNEESAIRALDAHWSALEAKTLAVFDMVPVVSPAPPRR